MITTFVNHSKLTKEQHQTLLGILKLL